MYGQQSVDGFGSMPHRGFAGFPQELLGSGFGAPGGMPGGLLHQQRAFGGLPPQQQGLQRGPGGFGLPQQQQQQQLPRGGGFGAPMQQGQMPPFRDGFGGDWGGGGFGGPPQQQQQHKGGGGGFGGPNSQQKGGPGGQQQQRGGQQSGQQQRGGLPRNLQQQMQMPGGQGNFKGQDMGGSKGGKGNRQTDKGGKGVGGGGYGGEQRQQFAPPPVPGVNPNGTANWSYGQTAKGLQPADSGKGGVGLPIKGDAKGMKGGKGMPAAPYGKGFEQPEVHSNCFVGNLQEGTTQAELEAAFAASGPVQSAFVASKEGRTYGFVKMMTVDGAANAIASLNGANGWIVKMANKDSFGASFSKGGFGKGETAPVSSNAKPTHTNVFVGSLKEGLTDAQLEKVFKSYGTVDSCVVMNKGEDKTYGFVEFSTIAEAQSAINGMNGQEGLVVKFSNNDNVPLSWDEAVPHSNLFVGSLPKGMAETELRKMCDRHGSVQSCTIRSDPEAEQSFGFVKMTTIAAARRVIKALNGHEGWFVKSANNDIADGKGGKGKDGSFGKGMFGKGMFPGLWVPPGGKGGKGDGGWVWTSSNQNENERPEPEPHDNLYIKNLPPGIKEDEVIATFRTAGDVVECRVLSWDGFSESAALVRMASTEQATALKQAFDGKVHPKCHQTLSVALQQKQGAPVPDHIFVKGFHCTTTPDQLTEAFGKVGEVTWSRILPFQGWPSVKQLPEGSALVQFATPEQAQAAIAEFDGKLNSELGVKMSVRYAEERVAERPEAKPNSNLYVKGWPVGFPDFLLQSVFQTYGQVVRLRLLDNPDPQQPTQAALVQMSREDEATASLKALHGHTCKVPVPAMRVKHAGREPGPSGNLYVSSLPRTITDQEIRETFKKFGEVARLRLLNQESSPEMRALVELSSPQLAQQAVRELDGTAPVFKGPMLYIQYASRKETGTAKGGGKGDSKGE